MRKRNISTRSWFRAMVASSVALGAIAAASPAFAQGEDGADEDDDIITVTGSRIARDRDYTATSPITTVDADLLEKSSAINLEANLNKLPQLAPALTQFGPASGRGDHEPTAGSTPGATTVSLRQLGANRNLVLIDGRRPTPVNGTGVVDINSIPSAAIERVEIITGGASSTYGADAVGGVVNFILKDDFQGLTVDGQYGLSSRGDGDEYRVSALFGAASDDGRSSVMLGLERYDRKEIQQFDRPWFQELYSSPDTLGNTIFGFEQTYFLFPTQAGRPANSGSPNQTWLNTFFQGKGAPTTNAAGAALNIPFAGGIYLNDDNTLFLNTSSGTGAAYTPLLYGYTGTYDGVNRKKTAGGLLRDNYTDQMLSTPMNRWSFFAKGSHEINDWIGVFGQVNYVRSQVFTRNLVAPAITSWSVLIPHGTDVFLGDYTLNNSPGIDGIYRSSDDIPMVGAINLGIPSSVILNGQTYNGSPYVDPTPTIFTDNPTHAAYRPGGLYDLNCGPVGGCTNSQVYPTPAELDALLNNRGTGGSGANQPFQVNKFLDELGERYLNNRTQTYQIMAGFEGSVPGTDWTWELYGSHGESSTKADQYNYSSVLRWRAVLSSPNYGKNFLYKGNSGTPGGGFQGSTGTCASGVNPFQDIEWSEDCKNAVRTNLQTESVNQQNIVEANLQGGLFELPYGEMRFAAGASYRNNKIAFHPDGQSTEGTSFLEPVNGLYPQGYTSGSVTAKEAYGELLVPLLSDLPFAEALNLELGYRLSNYNLDAVGTVSTYKINGEYAPVDWLRFRGGYQKASRAPNLAELFTARTSTLGTSAEGDPCSRANPANPVGVGNYSANPDLNDDAAQVEALCRQIMNADGEGGGDVYYRPDRTYSAVTAGFGFPTLVGNPHLAQEDATTYTIGAVITSPASSPWLSRLSLAVDYYNVDLTNAISQQGIDGVYRRCFSGLYNPNYDLNEFCALVHRTPGTGEVANVDITYSNAGRVRTSGIDTQLNWALNFEDAGIGLPGTFAASVQATYLLKFETTTDDGIIPLVDYVGTLGPIAQVGTNGGSYRFKLFSTFTYALNPFTISLQWQHKSAVNSEISARDANSNTTGAPAYNLFHLNGTVSITPEARIRFGVDNLFDKAPPVVGVNLNADGRGTLFGGSFDTAQYDVLGRRFYVGATLDF
jgi:iron complex outermembrane receptor protein